MLTPSILAGLGGADGVAATVDDLYRRMLADPELAPYFRGIDLARIRTHMTAFLVAALDGADTDDTGSLEAAHSHLGVTDDAFDATASHLLDALEGRQVHPDLLDSVLERIAPLRSVVVQAD
ncbi:MAG: group 1 truncated hemoglobin [Friedmanniella sp.]